GSEQEYFLIDKDLYKKRKDLLLTGRTLIGAPAPKGQEMEDHYFGVLKPKVSEYMHDLDEELWKLGVPAKTKHNEVAPAQHELAPVFETANVAVDHNQLTMEMMKKVADKHHYACLLHEKPFAGVNGSGKHDNWSIVTNTKMNLLDPGSDPYHNKTFLIFLLATISAVDNYQDLLRISVASAGNDHRLGANEAPPAVVSIFVGDELAKVLDAIDHEASMEKTEKTEMSIGAAVLPNFVKDPTDRNRTSPFAFTGNKFEFRMPGSSLSVADPNIIHKRILFNGNGYTDAWLEEAKKRGLFNLKSLPDALPQFKAEKNVDLFTKYHIFTESEIDSRYEIKLENYSKTIHIEALTMIDMVKRDFTPALFKYMKAVESELLDKKALLGSVSGYDLRVLKELDACSNAIDEGLAKLEADVKKAEGETDSLAQAEFYHDVILKDMDELRVPVDTAEAKLPSEALPYPTYDQLLFSLR
uniref:glutamine synthetase type III n=1 Tax=uncultured Sharpea sp. TaxID=1112738 RepID=UPI002585FF6F